MYIKFKKNVAQGIYYTHAGIGQTAYARKEIIISAGHRSSLLLENSGVGNKVRVCRKEGERVKALLQKPGRPKRLNSCLHSTPTQMILEPILSRVGFPMVADVPGVGDHLGNDGVVLVALNRSRTAAVDPNPNDLYFGGAFTPYPNPSANPDNPVQTTLRFGQLFGADNLAPNTFTIGQ